MTRTTKTGPKAMPSAPEASHPGLAAAERLRRVRDALEAGEIPDAADAGWLAQGLERYLTGAAAGVKLEGALGVAVLPGGSPWWSEQRRAERDAAIRRRWPRVDILVRGDSHYGRPEAMSWCERNRVGYVFGLAGNTVLLRRVAALAEAVALHRVEGEAVKVRRFGEFTYAAKTCSVERRVIGRVEASNRGQRVRMRPSRAAPGVGREDHGVAVGGERRAGAAGIAWRAYPGCTAHGRVLRSLSQGAACLDALR